MVRGETPPPGAKATAEGLTLPRHQSGLSPQRLLLTLLGDYWYGRAEHLPSAALVALLGDFGVGAAGARSALMRLSRRGLLTASQVGRRTFYGLTAQAGDVLAEGVHHIFAFGREAKPWPGRWAIVAFSIPEGRRDLRHVLRTRLRWLGFAPLLDGVWVSPWPEAGTGAALLRELGVDSGISMLATIDDGSGLDPLSAWNLDAVRAEYDAFIAKYEPVRREVDAGRISGADAFVTRTEVMGDWRGFPAIDPGLPDGLVAADWPRQAARALFVEVYDRLGPPAEAHYRDVVSRFDPELGRLASHHTSTGLPS